MSEGRDVVGESTGSLADSGHFYPSRNGDEWITNIQKAEAGTLRFRTDSFYPHSPDMNGPTDRRCLLAVLLVGALGSACTGTQRAPGDSTASPAGASVGPSSAALPVGTDTLQPAVITDTVPGDSDDPAIWVNRADPAKSIVLGTDKGDSTGGVYVFGLDGHIDHARSATPLRRMNNVDVEYGMAFGTAQRDIAVATERRRMSLRVFTLPDMKAVDGGGIVVFEGDTARAPMGIALYKRPRDGQVFAIVGGKSGPTNGTYLAQYALRYEAGKWLAQKCANSACTAARKKSKRFSLMTRWGTSITPTKDLACANITPIRIQVRRSSRCLQRRA